MPKKITVAIDFLLYDQRAQKPSALLAIKIPIDAFYVGRRSRNGLALSINRDRERGRLFLGLGCAPLFLRANFKHYPRRARKATGVERDKRRSPIDKSAAQFPLARSLTSASEYGACFWRGESVSITSEARGHLTATTTYQAARRQIDRSKSPSIAPIYLFR